MIAIEPVTVSEAQFLLGRPEKELNRAIDRGEIDRISEKVPQLTKKQAQDETKSGVIRGKTAGVDSFVVPSEVQRTVRKLGAPELLFLVIEGQVRDDLTPSGRKKLYRAIKSHPVTSKTISFGPFQADIAKAVHALKSRYKRLDDVRRSVMLHTGQDPVIKGTKISVYRVAALAQGQSIPEIMEDYPSLTAEQVRLAIDYAIAYPKAGRPYPERSFKRTTGALADLGVFGPFEGESEE